MDTSADSNQSLGPDEDVTVQDEEVSTWSFLFLKLHAPLLLSFSLLHTNRSYLGVLASYLNKYWSIFVKHFKHVLD